MPCWCGHNDPCGICCATFTYGLLIFADYVVVTHVLYPWLGGARFYLTSLAFVGISLLAMSSHLRCMLTDPGAIPRGYQPGNLVSFGPLPARAPAPEPARAVFA